jgi:hypothetical protein
MQKKNRRPVGLEALEDRWVPASVHFDGSNLTVYNLFITGGASKTTIVESTKTGYFTVTDNVGNQGTYAVTGNITVYGNNAKDAVTVTVDGGAPTGLLGNLSVYAGNGSTDSITIDSTTAVGTIYGNVGVSLGDGLETVKVGSTLGLEVNGNTYIRSASTGTSTATLGGGTSTSKFLGNVSVSGFPETTLGGAKADIFAGSVTVNNSSVTNGSSASTVTLATTSKIYGSLTVLGALGGPTTVTVDGSVLGNLTVELGNGTNSVNLGAAANPIQIGNVDYIAGNGVNVFNVGGAANNVVVTGNVDFNWGNGSNSFGTSAGLTVEGSFYIDNGNGGLNVVGTKAADAFEGQVYGNLSVSTGNGPNQFDLSGTNGAIIGGTWYYNGGNGGNSLTIDNGSSNSVTMNLRMGTLPANNVTITAATDPGTLTGYIDWAVPSAANPAAPPATINGFVDNGYVWTNAITLVNVPS